jgi:hypothetical protein
VEALPKRARVRARVREGIETRRSTPGLLNNGLQGRLRGLQSMFTLGRAAARFKGFFQLQQPQRAFADEAGDCCLPARGRRTKVTGRRGQACTRDGVLRYAELAKSAAVIRSSKRSVAIVQ